MLFVPSLSLPLLEVQILIDHFLIDHRHSFNLRLLTFQPILSLVVSDTIQLAIVHILLLLLHPIDLALIALRSLLFEVTFRFVVAVLLATFRCYQLNVRFCAVAGVT